MTFSVNRCLLLSIIACSAIIPLIYLPHWQKPVDVELVPAFSSNYIQITNPSVTNATQTANNTTATSINPEMNRTISLINLLIAVYGLGVLVSIIVFLKNIIALVVMSHKTTIYNEEGYKIYISDRPMPSFAFARTIIISQEDYDNYGDLILSHEKAHIQLRHFDDLIFMELVKILHWFNPTIYGMLRHLKEIHEYQADEYAIRGGIDAQEYQLLLIKKSVGPQRFALANSFNHCQIKKRITMMNNQKNSKVWRWKMAIFFPVLALLLMSFSKESPGEPKAEAPSVAPSQEQLAEASVPAVPQAEMKDRVIYVKADGNYILGKKCSLDEIAKKGKEWNSNHYGLLIQIDKDIPQSQVDKVRIALKDNSVWGISETTTGSDEIIYFSGDVNHMAYTDGWKYNAWMNEKLAEYIKEEDFSDDFNINYYFIVDKNGKVRDAHIVKPTEFPKVNEAYAKALSEMPDDWVPAKRGSENVSVYHYYGQGRRKITKTVDGETIPTFPGGDNALMKYLKVNVKYPEEAENKGIQGRVYVQFVVLSNGKITDVEILKSVDELLDAEAVRIVSSMPDWNPGTKDGKAIDVNYRLPINFTLRK